MNRSMSLSRFETGLAGIVNARAYPRTAVPRVRRNRVAPCRPPRTQEGSAVAARKAIEDSEPLGLEISELAALAVALARWRECSGTDTGGGPEFRYGNGAEVASGNTLELVDRTGAVVRRGQNQELAVR